MEYRLAWVYMPQKNDQAKAYSILVLHRAKNLEVTHYNERKKCLMHGFGCRATPDRSRCNTHFP